jgi:electron transfer flavoprotein alpha subunit
MTEILLIAFDKTDIDSLANFANAMGGPFDLVCLSDNGTIPPADAIARALAEKTADYSVAAFPATMEGKDVAPRVAALLNRPMVSDIIAVEADNAFLRPMFAGNVTAKVIVQAERFVVTVRATAFQGAAEAQAQPFALPGEAATKRIRVDAASGGRPDLSQANVVVSGGRPLKDADTFERLIGGLADKLGGAAGATRAAVDSGIAANELQVGQTGKIVAPGLYIAAGISGSTQHIAGMKDSKVIVAINTDADAPIFEVADFGLVMDLYQAIPELMEKLP